MKTLKAVIEQHIKEGGLVTNPTGLSNRIVDSVSEHIHSLVWANIEAVKKDCNKTSLGKLDAAEKRMAKWLGVTDDLCPGHD